MWTIYEDEWICLSTFETSAENLVYILKIFLFNREIALIWKSFFTLSYFWGEVTCCKVQGLPGGPGLGKYVTWCLGRAQGTIPVDAPQTLGRECGSNYIFLEAETKKASNSASISVSICLKNSQGHEKMGNINITWRGRGESRIYIPVTTNIKQNRLHWNQPEIEYCSINQSVHLKHHLISIIPGHLMGWLFVAVADLTNLHWICQKA